LFFSKLYPIFLLKGVTKMLTTSEAAKIKGCSDQAIIDAISQGKIDGEKFGWAWAIKQNKKFEEWQPSGRQKSGRARWASTRSAKKSRRTA
jgi:hypothetical protein